MNAEALRDAYLSALRRARARNLKKRIKHAFIDRDLSLRQLARRLGISPTLLSFILAGKHVGHKYRPKIARALGLSVEELFGGSNGKRRAA